MGYMNNQAREALALEMIEAAEVLHEFDDSVTLRIDRELWEEFIGKQDEGE